MSWKPIVTIAILQNLQLANFFVIRVTSKMRNPSGTSIKHDMRDARPTFQPVQAHVAQQVALGVIIIKS